MALEGSLASRGSPKTRAKWALVSLGVLHEGRRRGGFSDLTPLTVKLVSWSCRGEKACGERGLNLR